MCEKILEGVCNRKTRKYIPQSVLWISKPFTELANRNDRVCLTLDCSGANIDGPGRFRTEAEKPDSQTCYFNVANDEQVYNKFVSQRINKNESNDRIQFKIIHLKSKTNREENFDTIEELLDLTKNNGVATNRSEEKELEHFSLQNPLNSLVQELEKDLELNQNFFLGYNVDSKQSNTKINPKRRLKNANLGKTTVQQKLNCEIF